MDGNDVTRLRIVIARMARDLNATATDEGLTPTQASVLGLVAARGPIGLAELAELGGLNPTLVSRVVSALDDLGLIDRVRDPADMRAAQAAIRPNGRKLHERIRDERAKIIASCMDRLPEPSVRILTSALPALEALAEEVRLAAIAHRSGKLSV